MKFQRRDATQQKQVQSEPPVSHQEDFQFEDSFDDLGLSEAIALDDYMEADLYDETQFEEDKLAFEEGIPEMENEAEEIHMPKQDAQKTIVAEATKEKRKGEMTMNLAEKLRKINESNNALIQKVEESLMLEAQENNATSMTLDVQPEQKAFVQKYLQEQGFNLTESGNAITIAW